MPADSPVAALSCGASFVLGWLVLRCVRGKEGVEHMGKFLVANYHLMVSDFHAFCKDLIAHAKQLCVKFGKTFLAHREGFHCSLSGLTFLLTLRRKECRDALLNFARACGDHVTRLIQNGRRSQVGTEIFLKLMEELSSITLAVRAGGKPIHMARYNIMDAARCFLVILEKCVGCRPFEYTEEEHVWMLKRQTKKVRTELVRDMAFFKIGDAASMRQFMSELEHLGTVRQGNAFVLCCEGRQSGNHYGMFKLRALLDYARAHSKQSALKQALASKRDELSKTGGKGKCHTLQMLEVVRRSAGSALAGYLRTAKNAKLGESSLTNMLLDC